MRIVCVGGGPAGLYFSISAKLRDAGHEITVIERDPPEATYGWGVVYWNDLLDILHANDPESAAAVSAGSVLWQGQEIQVHGARHDGTAYFGGYGYSMGRAALLDVLTRRARQLGVDVRHGERLADPADLPEADLILAADGASSRIRQSRAGHFGTTTQTGRNPYIWLGTDRQFDSFVFCFEETEAGWIWFHAYPSIRGISTCIVECSPATWQGLGLDAMEAEEAVPLLEKIFHRALDGHSLISRSRGAPAQWQRFTHITNRTWVDGNVVLVGDAAHTTHFTLGSGTRLAMIDAIVLAHSLTQHADLRAALRAYDEHRREELHPVQAGARSSMAWFEQLDDYLDRDPVSFAYAMAVRTGRQPPWRYQVHLANQVPALRQARRAFDMGRRWYEDRKRGGAPLPLLGRSLPGRRQSG
ncbi:FAD-dependent monooxygenase [Streptomyces broussonetiae]|uniref:FAD-binding monooxygenase n=1 Tax=Streptomyces broussonetiae TaxID=2686304 RepID=A0A6I6N472_9ACTN|nr:FAD-dependent monooxygenase [Streptomyces broussonetiae]QHA04840.1 FAD-binding monooxygenase [Streptomyces broussonetiae]